MRLADEFIIKEGLGEPDRTVEDIWAIETEKRLTAYKEGYLKILMRLF